MVDVMVDLETLGTSPGCKILSIGAVVFGPAGLGAEFYVEVLREYQGDLVEDSRTIEWWSKQEASARDRLFNQHNGQVRLAQALDLFDSWLAKQTERDDKGNLKALVWGNGADFDNAMLKCAYDAISTGQPPWGPCNNRCYRTLKNLAPQVKLERTGTHHNALDDAKSQALHAVQLFKALGVKH